MLVAFVQLEAERVGGVLQKLCEHQLDGLVRDAECDLSRNEGGRNVDLEPEFCAESFEQWREGSLVRCDTDARV